MKATSVHVTNHEAAAGRNYKIALTGLFAALSYVVFTFLQIKITLPAGTPPPFTWATRSACLGPC